MSGAPPLDAPSNSGGTDDGGASTKPAPPARGLRADWFDLFAEERGTTFPPAIALQHDEATAPASGLRGVLYSARFSASLEIATSGKYTFFTRADDGVRVTIDDRVVIDDWKSKPASDATGVADLTSGLHELRVEYFQLRGAATLALEWQPPASERGAIPTELLTPRATAPVGADKKPLEGPRPTFENPVVPFDCPDPGVIVLPSASQADHTRFAMVCTGGSFPIRISDDLVTWKSAPGAAILPSGKAAWSANGGRNWAPEIHKVGATYVAYYTAVNGNNVLSIGCASATDPFGPYTDRGSPLVEASVGVIDATFFEDTDGKRYLYYKIDGNSVGQRTPIYVRELSADGLSFAPGSSAVEVLNNDQATWEGGVVEAPWVVKHGGDYVMFYSGNVYDDRYRTGVAKAKSPKGPFTKRSTPILANNAKWVGPGHGTVLHLHGRDWFFHHAWPALPNGKHDTTKGRYGLLAPITWGADGWPSVGGSSPIEPMDWP
jgi:GH43 family beta-xylosidase